MLVAEQSGIETVKSATMTEGDAADWDIVAHQPFNLASR